jgi:hypothetical protein
MWLLAPSGNETSSLALRRNNPRMKANAMTKMVSTVVAALLMAGLSAGAASAKQKRHGMHGSAKMQSGMTTGQSRTGGNAALSGNNGNSGSGDNSLGNVKGGNAGGMR